LRRDVRGRVTRLLIFIALHGKTLYPGNKCTMCSIESSLHSFHSLCNSFAPSGSFNASLQLLDKGRLLFICVKPCDFFRGVSGGWSCHNGKPEDRGRLCPPEMFSIFRSCIESIRWGVYTKPLRYRLHSTYPSSQSKCVAKGI
jgi:hypothetical protein